MADDFRVGEYEFRRMSDLDVAFGAMREDFPNWKTVERYQGGAGEKIADHLFFSGGSLLKYGRNLKDGVDTQQFYMLIRALLGSFAPKHEVKMATVGALIETYTDPIEGKPT